MQSKMLVGVLARLCSHLREMAGLTIQTTVSHRTLCSFHILYWCRCGRGCAWPERYAKALSKKARSIDLECINFGPREHRNFVLTKSMFRTNCRNTRPPLLFISGLQDS